MNCKTKLLLSTAAALSMSGYASAATLLFADNFNSESYGVSTFNNTIATDQSGPLATISYTVAGANADWQIQHGNGGEMFIVGTAPIDGYVSLNYDFSGIANTLNQALRLDFDLRINGASDPSNWATFAMGSAQNAFVTASTNKFSSLFRENGGTQQFASGTLVGDTATWTSTGSTISYVISDTTGSGSAFNGNGSVAKLYVDNVLQDTFTLDQLGAGDGFISFEAIGAFGVYDNLAISAVPEPASAALGILGLGGLFFRRRRSC